MWHGWVGYPAFHMGGWGIILFMVILFIFLRGRHCRWGYQPDNRMKKSSALDILDERYARGEITKAEYDQTKQDLQA